jgi:hypothetical protein
MQFSHRLKYSWLPYTGKGIVDMTGADAAIGSTAIFLTESKIPSPVFDGQELRGV